MHDFNILRFFSNPTSQCNGPLTGATDLGVGKPANENATWITNNSHIYALFYYAWQLDVAVA